MGCASSVPVSPPKEDTDEELFSTYSFQPRKINNNTNAISSDNKILSIDQEQPLLSRSTAEEATTESTHSDSSQNVNNLNKKSKEKENTNVNNNVQQSTRSIIGNNNDEELSSCDHFINEIAFKQLNESVDGLSDDECTMTSWEMRVYNKEDNKKGDNNISQTSSSSSSDNEMKNKDNKSDDNSIISGSEESDTDWDSVDSSSGSEGDGLKRGVKKSKVQKIVSKSSKTQYLVAPRSGTSSVSSDDSDGDPDFFKGSNTNNDNNNNNRNNRNEDDGSEGSLDHNDLLELNREDIKQKNATNNNRGIEVTSSKVQSSPISPYEKNLNGNNNSNNKVYDQNLFDALVDQLDASMSSLDDNTTEKIEKPGPPKSPGNTSHERIYRQNFNGNTLKHNNNNNESNKGEEPTGDEEEDLEPDFYEEDHDNNKKKKNNNKILHPLDSSLISNSPFMNDSVDDFDTLMNDLRQTSEQNIESNNNNNISSPIRTTKELKNIGNTVEEITPKMDNKSKSKVSMNDDSIKSSSTNNSQNKNSKLPLLNNSVSDLIELNNSDSEDGDSYIGLLNNPAVTKKPIKKNYRNPDENRMMELINLDPWDENIIFDEDDFLDLIINYPIYCDKKYELEAFDAKVYPLSAICALNASIDIIKKCYKAAPNTIKESDKSLGTPLHFACSFGASDNVIKFLIKKYPEALQKTDEFDRTPLHAAALFKADVHTISILLKEYPEAASKPDEEKMTPLHLAIETEEGVDIDSINKLIKAYPAACIAQSLTDKVTPLMLAVARQCSLNVIKTLIKENESPLRIPDKEGRIPLHVAAALKADIKVIKLLVKSYPEGASVKDNAGELPLDLGKKVKLEKDTLSLLEP